MPFLPPNQQRQCTEHERLELNTNAHRVTRVHNSLQHCLQLLELVYTRSASMRIEIATVL